MPINAAAVSRDLGTTAGAATNLSAACQGILSTQIAPTPSQWYPALSAELEQAKALAIEWRESESGSFQAKVLSSIADFGTYLAGDRPNIERAFDEAAGDPGQASSSVTSQLALLKTRFQGVSSVVADYKASLKDWGQRLHAMHLKMGTTVSQVQAQAQDLQGQIEAANRQIADLQRQINDDRNAIARAEEEQDKGRTETIIGSVLAPFTGGVSVILIGIGVSSMSEAKGRVEALERSFRDMIRRLNERAENLGRDQAQLIALNSLSISSATALNDVDLADQSLDGVRVSWDMFSGELDGAIDKINKATSANDIVLERAWFEASCGEWALIVSGMQSVGHG